MPKGRSGRSQRLAAVAATIVLLSLIFPIAAAGVTAPAAVNKERVAGPDRYATAVAISQRLVPSGGVPVVYLASGEGFADAVAAAPLAAHEDGVVLLTRRDVLPAVVETELVRLAPERVVVAGGPPAIRDGVVARVAQVTGAPVERAAGRDRYATAAALSAGVFAAGSTPTVFLATGAAFPDALAAGPAATALAAPVLLTAPTALPAATAAELRRLGPSRVIVLGGTPAVSAAVVSAVQRLGIAVERVAGRDRFATAAAVAARFAPTATTAVLATGFAFPDALAGAPLAASLDAPILLVQRDGVPAATRDAVLAARPATLVTLGSTAAVWDAVPNELAAWSDGELTLPPTGEPTYPSYDSRYHDYGEMLTEIRVAQAAYPDLVRVSSIGKSAQGRDIWMAKVSDNVTVDENEPEVLVDALHHSGEHLTVEQALYLLRTLTHDYASDPTVHRLVDSREIWIVFAVNPDGWAYDLTGNPYRGWRKNRQATPGSSAIGTDINRNYDYHWGCCGGSSSSPAAWNYRGPSAFSTPEAQVIRDFVLSRVVDGVQQIRTHVTLHTDGELILWPYGYTKADIPHDMTAVDHATFVAMARAMAARNGYRPEQSSDLYVTDGDEIDWMYGRQHIFSFTFELYPKAPAYSQPAEAPDEAIATQTARNRAALLYLIDMAACPYAAIGRAATYCPSS